MRRTNPPRRDVIDQRVLSGRDRLIYLAVTSAWGIANLVFWSWWFNPDHVITWPRFIAATIAVAYDLTLMPLVLIFFLWKMKQPKPIPASPGLRVAMATAIVPSAESLETLERTLAAMVAVRYPHDSWVLDEGGDSRVRELCQRYGAYYWSRHGVPEFNQDCWPFQAKTKSGNYNAWFSQIGYKQYDYFVQLDTDHAPDPSYLDEVLGYFADPSVAYIALPSVYWNLNDWPSRGSSEQSQVFQGPIQMGYYGWAKSPMIIGSHAAYRMEHLEEIGGFAPSRAEDHLDTLKFAQAGYRGVFVPKNLAFGLGPHTLSDYLVQEHQWAFSIAQVLMKYGREKGLLTFRQRLIFLFSELWYGIYSTTYLIFFMLPLLALLTNTPIVKVPFLEFIMYSQPIVLIALIGLAWCYKRGWFKPGNHLFISWQGIILSMARWPIVLIAIVNAVISVAFRNGAFTYMVTPKGTNKVELRHMLRVAAPFVVLASVPIVVALLYPKIIAGNDFVSAGYIVFALLTSVFFTLLILAAMIDYIQVNRRAGSTLIRAWLGAVPLVLICASLAVGISVAAETNRPHTLTALTYWPTVTANDSSTQTATRSAGADVSTEEPASQQSSSDDIPAAVPTETVTPARVTPTADEQGATLVPAAPSEEPPATLPVSSWLFDTSRSGVTFGAYDPEGGLADISGLDHIFMSWGDTQSGGVPVADIRSSYENGRPVMLSLEPWPLNGKSAETLLQDIVSGKYESTIGAVAKSIASIEQPVLIRFGHEMDLAGLYPWAGADPGQYISAYQHVVNSFRVRGVTNVIWVWSPAGTIEAPEYYPGDAYVDYVGTTILQFSVWEREIMGVTAPRPIAHLFREKYDLLEQFGMPIIFTEVGIDVNPTNKLERITEMIGSVGNFPLVRGIVYFNSQNPPTPITESRPNWSLTEQEISVLRETIAENPWIEQQAELPELDTQPAPDH